MLRIFIGELEEAFHIQGHTLTVLYDDNARGAWAEAAGVDDEHDETGNHTFVMNGQGPPRDYELRLQSCIVQLVAAEPARAVCVLHSAANGRIGLMLRRLPPLVVMMRCEPRDGGMSLMSARLGSERAGGSHAVPVPRALDADDDDEVTEDTEQRDEITHDHSATSTEVEPQLLARPHDEWARGLIWSMNKVYCCRETGCLQSSRPYASLVDDEDEWAKVEWGDADGATLVQTAGEAAQVLAQRAGKACTVHVALELTFGRPPPMPSQQQAGASEAVIRADPNAGAHVAAGRRGDLMDVRVRSAVVD